jgi:hypothetical protein
MVVLSWVLGACAGTRGALPTSQPEASAVEGGLSIRAIDVYVPGPWERRMIARVGDVEAVERRTASAPDGNGVWTLRVEQARASEGADPDDWQPLQTLTLARTSDGAVVLLELVNSDRATRSEFCGWGGGDAGGAGGVDSDNLGGIPSGRVGLTLMAGTLEGSSRFESAVRTWRGKGFLHGPTPDARRASAGRATSEAHAARDGDAIVVATTLTLDAGPAIVTRESELRFVEGAGGSLRLLRDRTTLRVRVGPLTIERSTREAVLEE